jgi:DNA-binding response OmpR family regulator
VKILLVEDNVQLAAQLERSLKREEHEVTHAEDGPAAVDAAARHAFDIIVLDVNLPGFDGFEVLRRIRATGLPRRVLMLTARSEIGDRVAGLRAGADDYLTKPFALEEFLARVQALGRRGTAESASGTLANGDLIIEVTSRRVTRGGERIELSPREFEVLRIFMQETGRTFTRDEICERIWEREHEYDTRTVEIFIMRLRKKLDRANEESVIRTIRSVGYMMSPPP